MMTVVTKDVPHIMSLSEKDFNMGKDTIMLPSGRCVTYYDALTLRYAMGQSPRQARLLQRYMNRKRLTSRIIRWMSIGALSTGIPGMSVGIILFIT